jgi:hypothetical protein
MPHRQLIAVIVCGCLASATLAPRAAIAAPPPAPLAPPAASPALSFGSASQLEPPAPHREWYGWQLMAIDLASIGLLISGTDGAFFGLFTGAPMIHALHGDASKVLGSLGLRTAGVFGGALVGAALCGGSCEGLDSLGHALAGAAIGMSVGMIIDWTVLGHGDVEAPRFAPAVQTLPGGGTAGFSYRF